MNMSDDKNYLVGPKTCRIQQRNYQAYIGIEIITDNKIN